MELEKRLSDEIAALCEPELILLYGRKTVVSTQNISHVDLCVVVDNVDRQELERRIYMEIDVGVSFNVIIYSLFQWDEQLKDATSFASRITEKGTVLYGRET